MQRDVLGDNQAPDENLQSVASLDPGVRTFMTVYSADGEVVEWGPITGCQQHLVNLEAIHLVFTGCVLHLTSWCLISSERTFVTNSDTV